MDGNVPQVSFVPKATPNDNAPVRKEQVNIFVILGILVLFVAVGLWGGFFVYGRIVDERISGLETDIELSQKSLNTSVVIELVEIDKKIKEGKKILAMHTTIVPLLELLGNITLTQTVRYNSFSYIHIEDEFRVTLRGEAVNLDSLAYQVELFENEPSISSFSVSDITLGSSEEEGSREKVNFSMNINIKRDLISYERLANGGSVQDNDDVDIDFDI